MRWTNLLYLEDVAGEEVPASGACESDEEELLAAHATSVTDSCVDVLVEGVEERAGNEVGRPDHGRGDTRKRRDTTDGETDLGACVRI